MQPQEPANVVGWIRILTSSLTLTMMSLGLCLLPFFGGAKALNVRGVCKSEKIHTATQLKFTADVALGKAIGLLRPTRQSLLVSMCNWKSLLQSISHAAASPTIWCQGAAPSRPTPKSAIAAAPWRDHPVFQRLPCSGKTTLFGEPLRERPREPTPRPGCPVCLGIS